MLGDEPLRIVSGEGDPFGGALRGLLRRLGYLPRRQHEARVWVLSPALPKAPQEQPPPESYLIFKGDSAPSAALAARGGVPFLDYGFTRRASLTFSSREERTAVIALQRPLLTLSGGIIDPMELPVHLSIPLEDDLLLSAVAVLLISEKQEALYALWAGNTALNSLS